MSKAQDFTKKFSDYVYSCSSRSFVLYGRCAGTFFATVVYRGRSFVLVTPRHLDGHVFPSMDDRLSRAKRAGVTVAVAATLPGAIEAFDTWRKKVRRYS